MTTSTLTKKQTRVFRVDYMENGDPITLIAEVRYDDECGNGHNSFAITGDLYEKHAQPREPKVKHATTGRTLWLNSCGCLHDEIEKRIPELAPLIKWHLTSSDGPMYYIENTLYHALEHGPTHAWVVFDGPENGIKEKVMKYCKIDEAVDMCTTAGKTFNFVSGVGYRYKPDEKTAKVRNLEYARSSAVWPDATDEELSAPPAELKAKLLARLPALMAEFRAAVESLGFTY